MITIYKPYQAILSVTMWIQGNQKEAPKGILTHQIIINNPSLTNPSCIMIATPRNGTHQQGHELMVAPQCCDTSVSNRHVHARYNQSGNGILFYLGKEMSDLSPKKKSCVCQGLPRNCKCFFQNICFLINA